MTLADRQTGDAYSLLPWDSNLFGYLVARVEANVSPETLAAAVGEMREKGIRLAYWFRDQALPPPIALELVDVRLVDEKLTFVISHLPPREVIRPGTSIITTFEGTEPDSALIALSRAAGEWSRFRIDPKVPPGVFETMYDTWIRKSVSGEIADIVLCSYDAAGLANGMVTVGRKGAAADIGLVAVDEAARGQGVGKALIRAAIAWTVNANLNSVQVVTQRANRPACALYESSGFQAASAQFVYHVWL